jgi:hypothetical protein
MFGIWRDCSCVPRVDDIIKAELEPCILAEGTKRAGNRQSGSPAHRIFAEILRIRPQVGPNLRMPEFGDAMLDRRSELLAAASGVYRTQLNRPQYPAEQMRSCGRGREIIAALTHEG